jgi:MSHA biogenesis protein MshQ
MPTIDGVTYSQRKAITISHVNVASTLSSFPLCVRITGDADIGGVCRPDGADLRFTDVGGNLLFAENESFLVLAGSDHNGNEWRAATGLFWVRVPSISASADTTIYCYYGNQQATAQSGSTSVWDANFHGVWHLDETSVPYFDSSTCGNLSSSTTNMPTPAAGLLGGAQLFSRTYTNYIAIDDSPSLGTSNYFSLSAWVKFTSIPSLNRYYDIAAKGDTSANYGFRAHSLGFGEVFYTSAEPASYVCVTSGTVFSETGTWYHVYGVYDGSFLRFYINGVQAAFLATTAAPAIQAVPLTIGTQRTSNSSYCMDGTIDEVRFSDIARSGDWIRFEYFNQKDLAGQLSWGPQQTFGTAVRPAIDGSLASGLPLLGALT